MLPVASALLDHVFGTLYQMTSSLLPLSPHSNPDSKLTSSLQLGYFNFNASNYRPIALTCVRCKLMESFIKDQLLSYLLFHKLISKHQHAFITNHSAATNLLECANDWSAAINAKKHIDIVYIDFCRAFDSIVYSKLLSKLQSFGIGGNFSLWLGAFLRNRSQRVCVDNCFSD